MSGCGLSSRPGGVGKRPDTAITSERFRGTMRNGGGGFEGLVRYSGGLPFSLRDSEIRPTAFNSTTCITINATI
jgi:hypothetical protein